MAAQAHRNVILPAHSGRKKLSFALTPLADAMFQLLIFFMLSTSLAPYSLITLTAGAAEEDTAFAPAETPAAQPAQPTIWHLSQGRLRMGTEIVPVAEASKLIESMRAGGSDSVVIFSGAGATVQDVATTLNMLTLAHVASVQIIAAGG